MDRIEKAIKQFLENKNIKYQDYTLINNFGFTFEYRGQKFDCRFWANYYGAYVGKWSLSPVSGGVNFIDKETITDKDIMNMVETSFKF